MTATRQVYTLTAAWERTELATVWGTILADAGLMTDWYDSWSDADNQVEHRVLALVNQAEKTYGTQYIWFAFDDWDVYVQFATAWDLGTHRPGGVLHLDRGPNIDPPDTSDFNCFLWPSSGQSFDLIRTTGEDGVTVISGAVGDDIGYPMVICPSIGAKPDWINFDEVSAFSVFIIDDYGYQNEGNRYICFRYPYSLGRNLFYGKAGWINATTSNHFTAGIYGATYACMGRGRADSWGSHVTAYEAAIQIPSAIPAQNPALTSASRPIVTGIQPFPPLPISMGPDFGFCQVTGTPPAFGDTITVSETEVWTVIFSDIWSSADQLCLVARTT